MSATACDVGRRSPTLLATDRRRRTAMNMDIGFSINGWAAVNNYHIRQDNHANFTEYH